MFSLVRQHFDSGYQNQAVELPGRRPASGVEASRSRHSMMRSSSNGDLWLLQLRRSSRFSPFDVEFGIEWRVMAGPLRPVLLIHPDPTDLGIEKKVWHPIPV